MSAQGSARFRGFSILELVIVVAVVGIVAAVAVPRLGRDQADGHSLARGVMGNLRKARSVAVAKPSLQGNVAQQAFGPPGQRFFLPGDRAVSAGIMVVSPAEYVVFLDNDRQPGQEVIIKRVDVTDSGYRISSPGAGGQIRFLGNGTRQLTSIDKMVLDNGKGETRSVTISAAGFARLD